MKKLLQFVRTTLVGGLLFLVPIVVLGIVLGKALGIARKIVEPLAAHLPVHSIIGLQTPLLLAVGGIVLLCFLAGFFARTLLARKIVNRLETAVLSNVPGYEFLKRMGESTLGVEKDGGYPVVLVRFDDAAQIGFQIGVLENGRVAVFVPGVPNANAGEVYIINHKINPHSAYGHPLPSAGRGTQSRRGGIGIADSHHVASCGAGFVW